MKRADETPAVIYGGTCRGSKIVSKYHCQLLFPSLPALPAADGPVIIKGIPVRYQLNLAGPSFPRILRPLSFTDELIIGVSVSRAGFPV